jgi:predicted phage terminase large subunit-like protein
MARRRLTEIRTARVQKRIATQANPGELDLLDFIPALNARYERPEHLARLADVFRRIDAGEAVRVLVSYPPQHGKSDLLVNGVARLLRRKPWLRNAYVCYGEKLVRKKSRQARDTAIASGVQLRDDSHAVNDWQTVEGGGLFSTGVGGPLTGQPVDGLLVVDDPHKDREDAESALARSRCQDWWSSTAGPRLHPSASAIISHTRWHEDDLIGWLSKETMPGPDGEAVPAWEVINVPAIDEQGHELWHLRPLSFLAEQRRRGEYDWWSLWMGSPRPRGTNVFRGAAFYDERPVEYRVGKGVDLAYTAKTRADYSCGVVVLQSGVNQKGLPIYYVAEVRRGQVEAPEFIRTLAGLNVSYPTGSWHWFCSTTEKGVAHIVSDGDSGVVIDPVLATADKFVRAQAVAVAWNDGRVLVPRKAEWLKAFVDELGAFTGVGDRHDDHVDALASAFAALEGSSGPPKVVAGTGTRWGHSDRGF